MQDDLKFASEAISQIALQAMKSIENLYANRHFDSNDSGNSNIPLKVDNSRDSSDSSDSSDFDDPRFSIIEEPEVEKVEKVEKVEISKPKVERPPKYDSDLENLLL